LGPCGPRPPRPGEHEPIIERALFEAVQAKLYEQRRGKRRSRTSSEALLLGRIFDDRGNRMTPSYAVKNGARYRYYVSCVLAQLHSALDGLGSLICPRIRS
jgi:hypothetical protein